MASKGQKFIRFTDEERTEIVCQYLSGQSSYKSIAKDRGISWKTVESMVRKYRNTGTTISKHKENGYNIVERKRGRSTMPKVRKKKENETDKEKIKRLVIFQTNLNYKL